MLGCRGGPSLSVQQRPGLAARLQLQEQAVLVQDGRQ
eukprot:CAMPEP_0118899846 /NCGR_PEP_ID=MMETSP1166-20130328/6230_1 /TAXON_ID=1104430 /ORGANISM="Chrysoreinhardia sp, Strain CCMP3193" /LENGTH=36 /DNA_ID= /DNA_START= /DNA_END= /DNA_ORIENTATION=